jgi:hypothetical protein
MLERVPEGKDDWRPHEKSMPLGYLAGLVATMPGWVAAMIDLHGAVHGSSSPSLLAVPPARFPGADEGAHHLAVHLPGDVVRVHAGSRQLRA